MTAGAPGAREGLRLLAERVARTGDALRLAASLADPPFDLDLGRIRRFCVTGLGSSAGNARFLAHLLDEHAGVRARAVPLGELLGAPPPEAGDSALVVFSQGLAPNARFALARPDAWARVFLMTAVGDASAGEKRALVAALVARGVTVLRYPEEDEYGSLVRVIGPLAGYVRAVRFAQAVAAAAGRGAAGPLALDVEPACLRVAGARAQVDALLGDAGPPPPGETIAFLASGGYADLVFNPRLKLLEGWLEPLPPIFDPIAFAHGPLQALHDRRATLIALTRPGDPTAPREEEVLGRLEATLDPRRHRVLRLPSALPAPLAVLEHEALLNELLLRGIAARGIDVAAWPGRGREAPLYDFAPAATPEPERATSRAAPLEPRAAAAPRRLDERTTAEVAAGIAGGARTAVLGLGATEQHGPHLPLATDGWIADELARRFCARVPEAVQLPTLALGCSPEHLDFAGTLSISPGTLSALLSDLVASLDAHGFERLVVFSAHGGNVGALDAAARALQAGCAGLRVHAYTDLGRITRILQRAAADAGVAAAAAGHHAGEVETSIVWALRPDAVRRDRLAEGVLEPSPDAQRLFQPTLRANAPQGVVGDPRGADPRRADAYLTAWTEELVSWYAGEKKRQHTNGT